MASDRVILTNLPEELSTSAYVTLSWTAVSAASGVLKGYVIYGREQGDETFLTRVPKDTTSWIDDGSCVPSDIAFPPDTDTTDGPVAKYVIVHKEKLILANIKDNPSRVMWSGGGPYIDKFQWSRGGGAKDIDKDDGTVITGIIESPEGKVIIFKERAIYQMTLSLDSTLGIVVPTVSKISGAIGAVAHRTIKIVENGIFFVGRKPGGGISLNSLDYEPNILAAVLRTAEISARIRPLLEGVNMSRLEEMSAVYYDNKYFWFVPIGGSTMRCIVYDRERLAFTGFHTFPNNPTCVIVYYDSEGKDHLIYGTDEAKVREISSSYSTDSGVPFECVIQLPKEVFTDAYRLKNLKDCFVNFKNPKGDIQVNIYVEDTEGLTSSARTFTISGQNPLAGWGSFGWGGPQYEISPLWGYNPSYESQGASDVVKYIQLNKANIRSAWLEIRGTGIDFEFLGAKLKANLMGEYAIPAGWRS